MVCPVFPLGGLSRGRSFDVGRRRGPLQLFLGAGLHAARGIVARDLFAFRVEGHRGGKASSRFPVVGRGRCSLHSEGARLGEQLHLQRHAENAGGRRRAFLVVEVAYEPLDRAVTPGVSLA